MTFLWLCHSGEGRDRTDQYVEKGGHNYYYA